MGMQVHVCECARVYVSMCACEHVCGSQRASLGAVPQELSIFFVCLCCFVFSVCLCIICLRMCKCSCHHHMPGGLKTISGVCSHLAPCLE